MTETLCIKRDNYELSLYTSGVYDEVDTYVMITVKGESVRVNLDDLEQFVKDIKLVKELAG